MTPGRSSHPLAHPDETFTVLIAEDQELVRLYFVDVLGGAGFKSLAARNGDEAFQILQGRDDIDALLTDVEMPGSLNGLALAGLARSGWPHLAIVVMSGRSLPENHKLPERTALLLKPCSRDPLLEELSALISVSRPLRGTG